MEATNDYKEFSYPWMSFTAINTYISCPRRFKFRYVDLFDQEETTDMKRGTFIHDIYERFFAEIPITKLKTVLTGQKLSGKIEDSAVYRVFLKTLESLIDKENPLMKDRKERGYIARCLRSFAIIETKRIYMLLAKSGELTDESINKYWYPFTVETMYANEELQLFGKVDRICLNADGTYDIIDYKTGGGKSKKKELNESEILQARIYMCIFSKKHNIDPKLLTHYIVYTNVSMGKLPNILSVKYNSGAQTKLLNKLKKIRKFIDAKKFDKVIDKKPLTSNDTIQEQKPFIYKRICGNCPYTMQCYNIEKKEFNSWSNSQFYSSE